MTTGPKPTLKNIDWSELEAITFDVDANLYNYVLMMPLKIPRWGRYVLWLHTLTMARQRIRKEGIQEDFRRRQAEIVSEINGKDVQRCYDMIERFLYQGWNEDFKFVRPYRGAREFAERALDNDVRIAVITDYPPHTKLKRLGFMDLPWTAIVEGEVEGALKPSPVPFRKALEAFDLQDAPDRVLHIGDSYNYDIVGAHGVGMRTAWLRRRWRFSRLPTGGESREKRVRADLVFSRWPSLLEQVSGLCGWK